MDTIQLNYVSPGPEAGTPGPEARTNREPCSIATSRGPRAGSKAARRDRRGRGLYFTKYI